MPLADTSRGIAGLFEHFSDRDFVGIQTDLRDGKEHMRDRQGSLGIATRHQRGPRRRADRRSVMASELATFLGHAIQVRSGHRRRAVRTYVAIAQVINIDEHNIGLFRQRSRSQYQEKQGCNILCITGLFLWLLGSVPNGEPLSSAAQGREFVHYRPNMLDYENLATQDGIALLEQLRTAALH